ncbi:MAG: TAXI family TRAP transporter solute-binding subunit [Syntrophobacteraceae bacterium]
MKTDVEAVDGKRFYMKKLCIAVFLCVISVVIQARVSHAIEMGIMTGNEKGTYYQFGLNLQELMAQHGIKLKVYPSKGSIENVYSVYKKHSTQLGIVQSDVLAFISRGQSNDTLKTVAKKIKLVLPLYNEEVHIVARKGITDFSDLSDRRVAVGEDGSGTYLTAKLLFEVSGIKPKDVVNIGAGEALMQLKEGKIDAMFYVAGAPVKLFAQDIKEEDNLELLPVMDKQILDFYPRAEIPAGTYAWQDKPVKTVAVKAVLVTYDSRTGECENVGKFARILSDNLDRLIQTGHPKWKAVDLDYTLKGWPQYDCVKKHLGTLAQKKEPARLNPVLDAIKGMLE